MLKKILIISLIVYGTMASGDVFVDKGVGAASIAMGGQSVAVGQDIFALYWNPGALGFLEGNSIGGMYSYRYGLSDMVHQFIASALSYNFIQDKSKFILAAGYESFGSGTIYNEGVLTGTVVFNLKGKYSAGLAMKYMRLSVGEDISTYGFATDFGIDLQLGGIVFVGYSAKNLISTHLKYDGTVGTTPFAREIVLPIKHKVGIGLSKQKIGKIELGTDLQSFNIGTELSILSFLKGRYGFSIDFGSITDLDSSSMRRMEHDFGLGFNAGRVKFDYSVSLESDLPLTHFFSVSAVFGSPKILNASN